jgi:hypothetical protein
MNIVTRRRSRPDPMTASGKHPPWCAADHSCNLGEHRAAPVTLTAPGGVIVLTRVQAPTGAQHVEIRTRIRLAPGEIPARVHLARVLHELDAHLRRVTAWPR